MIPIGAIDSALTSGAQATSAPAKLPAPDPKLLKAAKDFESIFVRQMLKSLEKTTAAGGGIKATAGQSSYGSMIVDSLSESVSKGGGLGLADILARSMMAAHPASQPTKSALSGSSAASAPAPSLIPTLKPSR